jgi:TonB-linked SusC/RagA family outer membrane protein
MKKSLLGLVALLLLTSVSALAQTVTGKVTSAADGAPIPGASVLIKGTSIGTATDTEGNFTLDVAGSSNSVLVVSFIGFLTQEVSVQNQTTVNVALKEDATQLSEVVVTALGIEKDSKTLTYSAQQVGGSQLTAAKDVNFVNSLAGKVPGLTINRSSAGPGGSARILLRGQKSTRDNQPLLVIDGVPISSTNADQTGDIWSTRDGGDILSMINPEDIESMSVLKGASASTLYGSLGQNGVILITTKKGKNGAAKVDFSSNITFDSPLFRPDLQYEYLQTDEGAAYSWGAKGASKDHVKSFFNTGTTWINSVSVTAGNEKSQTYLSYSNTSNNGIMPTSTFDQHTINLRQTAHVSDKFSVDGNAILGYQKNHNRVTGGLYFNPLTGLYLFPRGQDFGYYKDQSEYFSPTRQIYLQNWWNISEGTPGLDYQQNPYWILNRDQNDQTRQNVFVSLGLTYDFTDWLKLQVRGNVSDVIDEYEQRAHASTQATLADANGRYVLQEGHSTVRYADAILTGNRSLSENFGLTFTAGASIRREKFVQDNLDSKGSDLAFANVFTTGAVNPGIGMNALNRRGHELETQGLFGSVSLDYNKAIFVDLSARNDWSSSFAYTSNLNSGFFYYSGGVNFILTELAKLPEAISFAKVRGSYAKIGNGLPAYATSETLTYNAGKLVQSEFRPAGELEPEEQNTVEVGTEVRFMDDRLTFDLTLYKIENKNQFFNIQATRGAGVPKLGVNVGSVENKGIELAIGFDVLRGGDVKWNTSFNYTKNVNSVSGIPLGNGMYPLTEPGNNSYGLFLTEGGSFGDIYGKKFLRFDGKIAVDPATGKPVVDPAGSGGFQYLGNPMPKYSIGWNNTVGYKNFTLNVLVDGRVGGQVMSLTQALLDEHGVSQATADARNNGGVDIQTVDYVNGQVVGDHDGPLDAATFYQTVGGRSGISEYYVYSATNFRLRELSLSYRLPVTPKFVKDIRVSVVGRNLFFFQKDAPFDPEMSMSSGNGLQGVDAFGIPSTRSLGFGLKCTF